MEPEPELRGEGVSYTAQPSGSEAGAWRVTQSNCIHNFCAHLFTYLFFNPCRLLLHARCCFFPEDATLYTEWGDTTLNNSSGNLSPNCFDADAMCTPCT